MYIVTYSGPSTSRDSLAGSCPQKNKGDVVVVVLDPVRRLPQSTWMWCDVGNWKAILADWGALSEYFELLSVLLVYSRGNLSTLRRRLRWQYCAVMSPCVPREGKKHRCCSENMTRTGSDGFASAATLDSSSGWRKLNTGCACALAAASI